MQSSVVVVSALAVGAMVAVAAEAYNNKSDNQIANMISEKNSSAALPQISSQIPVVAALSTVNGPFSNGAYNNQTNAEKYKALIKAQSNIVTTEQQKTSNSLSKAVAEALKHKQLNQHTNIFEKLGLHDTEAAKVLNRADITPVQPVSQTTPFTMLGKNITKYKGRSINAIRSIF